MSNVVHTGTKKKFERKSQGSEKTQAEGSTLKFYAYQFALNKRTANLIKL